jgi:hypothetical protein
MQATELNFIIKAKEGKQYRSLMKFPCGLRQSNYNTAYSKAQSTLQALEQHGLVCKLITKYMPLYKPNTSIQLNLVGV